MEKSKDAFDQSCPRESTEPRGRKPCWILLFIVAGIIIATQIRKENPDLNIPSDEELFEGLPDNAKEAFTEKYGQPNDDDRECELYYLLAKFYDEEALY